MKKGNIISILMVVVAIIVAGYLYGDKIASKVGIDLHKSESTKVVETSKKDEPKKEEGRKVSPDYKWIKDVPNMKRDPYSSKINELRCVRYSPSKNKMALDYCALADKAFGKKPGTFYLTPNGEYVIEGPDPLSMDNNKPTVYYVFEKVGEDNFKVKRKEVPSKGIVVEAEAAQRSWDYIVKTSYEAWDKDLDLNKY
nr:MAG TPA: THIOL DISULFIDE INTERCHANGE PROTEIN DSBG, DSBG, CHAPERONE, PERIPLASMIC, REDOX-ACTIVE.9A [Caudoviricetes sp.]